MDGGREEWDWKVFFSDRGVHEVCWVGGVGWGKWTRWAYGAIRGADPVAGRLLLSKRKTITLK